MSILIRLLVLVPALVGMILCFAVLIVAGTLDALFNAVHLHGLSKHMTKPLLDLVEHLGARGQAFASRKAEEAEERSSEVGP